MARIRINYRDGKPSSELSFGGYAQIAAKRKYGLDAIKTDDPEVLVFGCFVELEGPAAGKDDEAFDRWLLTVEDWELIEKSDGTDNPPPAEVSSGTSPDSPPTSD